MRIAIPLADGRLAIHFGHSGQFALVDVDETTRQPSSTKLLAPPAHEPVALPRWLNEQGVTTIIAGGMGYRAQQMFAQNGVKVLVGAPAQPPEEIVAAYLDGTLELGPNACDH